MAEAYSPIAHGEALKNPVIAEMAKKYNVSVAQLCIRYCLQLDMLPIPKTANPKHMEDNIKVDFEITPDDMQMLMDMETIRNYGDSAIFPVFGGKMDADYSLEAGDFVERK